MQSHVHFTNNRNSLIRSSSCAQQVNFVAFRSWESLHSDSFGLNRLPGSSISIWRVSNQPPATTRSHLFPIRRCCRTPKLFANFSRPSPTSSSLYLNKNGQVTVSTFSFSVFVFYASRIRLIEFAPSMTCASIGSFCN